MATHYGATSLPAAHTVPEPAAGAGGLSQHRPRPRGVQTQLRRAVALAACMGAVVCLRLSWLAIAPTDTASGKQQVSAQDCALPLPFVCEQSRLAGMNSAGGCAHSTDDLDSSTSAVPWLAMHLQLRLPAPRAVRKTVLVALHGFKHTTMSS